MTVYVTQEQRDFFTENGYLVVKRVYRQEQLTRLCEEYAAIWLQLLASGQVKQQAHDPFASLYPNRLRDFHQDNEGIRDFMMEPSAIGVLKELIGEEPIAVQSGFYYKPPGTRGLGIIRIITISESVRTRLTQYGSALMEQIRRTAACSSFRERTALSWHRPRLWQAVRMRIAVRYCGYLRDIRRFRLKRSQGISLFLQAIRIMDRPRTRAAIGIDAPLLPILPHRAPTR